MMKEVTVIVPNRVGALAEVAEELGKNGVNITSLSVQGLGEHGVLRFITSDEQTAMTVLTKYIGGKKNTYEVRLNDVLTVKLPDRPGELAKLAKRISKIGVNIESVYQIGSEKGSTELVVRPEELDPVVEELKRQGFKVKV